MGGLLIKDEPPLIYHYEPLDTSKNNLDTEQWRAMVRNFLASIREERRGAVIPDRAVDLAQKVVGVGSVGTRCSIVLCLGGAEGDDPLFMQIKVDSQKISSNTWGRVPMLTTGSGWW